jgi:hypothetical protein
LTASVPGAIIGIIFSSPTIVTPEAARLVPDFLKGRRGFAGVVAALVWITGVIRSILKASQVAALKTSYRSTEGK